VAKAKAKIVVRKNRAHWWIGEIQIGTKVLAWLLTIRRGDYAAERRATMVRAANRLAAATGLPVIVED